jgi:DNA-binding GntR family transcriptional regulator
LAIEFKASKGLTEQIAEYLGARIIHMELKPGERLLEAKLASEMGVSRAPLREALRMLEMSGLVEFMPRRGVRVSELSEKTILGIADVLKELFGLVALRVVETGTREDYETLRTIRQSLSEYAEIEDISGYINASLQFAHSACRATKNLLLERVVLSIWPLTSRLQYISRISQKNGLKKNVEYFERVLNYYREGKADMAAKVMQDLVENESNNAIKYVREKGYAK